MKTKHPHRKTIAKLNIESVLEGKIASRRFEIFKRDKCKCQMCNLQGRYFKLEKDIKQGAIHLGLYGINEKGQETLFTLDHIKPISKGGKYLPENLQTACMPCNVKKGNNYEISMS